MGALSERLAGEQWMIQRAVIKLCREAGLLMNDQANSFTRGFGYPHFAIRAADAEAAGAPEGGGRVGAKV